MNFNDLPKDLSRFGFSKCVNLQPLEENRVMEIVDFIDGKLESQKAINTKIDSYGLKDKVERAMGSYVANGELIAAMLILDYKVKIDAPNAYFNLCQWSIKTYIDKYEKEEDKK